ncbi:venom peptide SjAPI-2-like [Anopheles maculipalpis]|uniref:venom peptide SjAPI-2-like n=1 Tax=Anopheles maculipalpis TaxID=1496333 RepID=UPI002158E227|nr:venom peptide SjAPI-2-like [Anopheles maculipalpis]
MAYFSVVRLLPFVVLVSSLTIGCMVLAQNPDDTETPPMECNRVNESYDPCGSGCGDLTCQNVRRNDVQCGRQCQEGCFCNRGYVRSRSGSCIPSYACATFG